jgi:hypothetical protein
LSGVDPGVRARRLDCADGIGRDQVEMPVDIRAALALRLTDAALVVREEGDPVLDVGGDERSVHEPRLLAAAVEPDDCRMATLLERQVDRAGEACPFTREVHRNLTMIGSLGRLAERDRRVGAGGICGIADRAAARGDGQNDPDKNRQAQPRHDAPSIEPCDSGCKRPTPPATTDESLGDPLTRRPATHDFRPSSRATGAR